MPTIFNNKHTDAAAALAEFKNDVADLLAMYASDQRAMLSRYKTQREIAKVTEAARVYQSAADEIREIQIVDRR